MTVERIHDTTTTITPDSLAWKALFWSAAFFTFVRPAALGHRCLRWWRAFLTGFGLLSGFALESVFDTFEFELLSKARPEEALSVVKHRIASNPEEGFHHIEAAWLCEALKRPQDALAFYEQASAR